MLQLVEDLERHSPTCVAGCAEPRVASGGALIGWADELWKGRVIDSSAFDNRTARLRQQLCPDADAWLQTPCGYPSPAQPDTYVNEEYFGIFAVNASCRVGDVTVDRLRPRLVQAQLKRLAGGGCVVHHLANATAAYDLDAWPWCGAAVAAARRGAAPGAAWDGFDCPLQSLVALTAPTVACRRLPTSSARAVRRSARSAACRRRARRRRRRAA